VAVEPGRSFEPGDGIIFGAVITEVEFMVRRQDDQARRIQREARRVEHVVVNIDAVSRVVRLVGVGLEAEDGDAVDGAAGRQDVVTAERVQRIRRVQIQARRHRATCVGGLWIPVILKQEIPRLGGRDSCGRQQSDQRQLLDVHQYSPPVVGSCCIQICYEDANHFEVNGARAAERSGRLLHTCVAAQRPILCASPPLRG